MMTYIGPVTTEINKRLEKAFRPSKLIVDNQSEQHAGHAGYTDGESHFHVTIVADVFKDMSRVQKQRMVMAELKDLMPLPIHALAMSVEGE